MGKGGRGQEKDISQRLRNIGHSAGAERQLKIVLSLGSCRVTPIRQPLADTMVQASAFARIYNSGVKFWGEFSQG